MIPDLGLKIEWDDGTNWYNYSEKASPDGVDLSGQTICKYGPVLTTGKWRNENDKDFTISIDKRDEDCGKEKSLEIRWDNKVKGYGHYISSNTLLVDFSSDQRREIDW